MIGRISAQRDRYAVTIEIILEADSDYRGSPFLILNQNLTGGRDSPGG